MIKQIAPRDIEKQSFSIIDEELGERGISLDPAYEHIIKRCIHTTADFDYASSLYISPGAPELIAKALAAGVSVVTDTGMAQAGINKKRIAAFGGEVLCFTGDEDVASQAAARGITRSFVGMEKAAALGRPLIFAIGNAPTALVSICGLRAAGRLDPVAVVGVPVGFVNVVEAKELLIGSGIPCIVARGRKGGSGVAACIINAIQYGMPAMRGTAGGDARPGGVL